MQLENLKMHFYIFFYIIYFINFKETIRNMNKENKFTLKN